MHDIDICVKEDAIIIYLLLLLLLLLTNGYLPYYDSHFLPRRMLYIILCTVCVVCDEYS